MMIQNAAKRHIDRQLIVCILASLLTALAAFLYFIIRGNGAFTLVGDFNVQQLTFPAAVQTALKEQSPGQWCWNLDLGSSLVNGFGFYELGSPFYWLSFLFPKTWFPYLVGWLYILKYVVASSTAYLYLRRFVTNRNYAVIGALVYAFSGFQAINTEFYHFHDVVAFFPLLLLGLEQAAGKDGKKTLFIFAVFLNCIVNYFFFVQEAVFLVIYFVIRFWSGWSKAGLRAIFRRMLGCLPGAVLGVGMAAILFIPGITYVTGSARSGSVLYLSGLVYGAQDLLYMVKGVLLPADPMNDGSALVLQCWNSTCCYLPLAGISLVIAYAMAKHRDWLKTLILLLAVISCSPVLQAGFLGFTATFQRWWYMFAMVMVLASVKVLDKPREYPVGKGIAWSCAVTLLFYLCVRYIPWDADGESVVYHPRRFLLWLIIAVAGPAILYALIRFGPGRFRSLLAATMCFCAATTGLTLYYYGNGVDPQEVLDQYTLGTQLKTLDSQYRYTTTDNMLTLTGNAAGIGCFSSTIENSSRSFDMLFDHWSENITDDKSAPGLVQLLAGKYTVTTDPNAANRVDEIVVDGTHYYVTESDACPIGFSVDYYVTTDELMSLEKDQRAIVLLNAAVVDAEDAGSVQGAASALDLDTIDFGTPVDTFVSQDVLRGVSDFSRDTSGFRCVSDYDRQSLVYFSVPYSTGWTAAVDGQKAEIVDSGGMMALIVPAGQHEVQFTYHTPGFRTGIAVSAVSWLLFAGYLVFRRVRRGTPVPAQACPGASPEPPRPETPESPKVS